MTLQNSYYPKQDDVTPRWYVVDAEGETTGRVASRIALLLRGKHLPTFTPSVNSQVYVVVVNADKVRLTGRKWTKKMYRWHTNFSGGFREIAARDLNAKKPGEVLREAVEGMLPHNRLGSQLKRQLRIFAGPEHTHEAQQPVKVVLGGLTLKPVAA